MAGRVLHYDHLFAFSDAGLLRAAAVAQHIVHVVPLGPGAVRSEEIPVINQDPLRVAPVSPAQSPATSWGAPHCQGTCLLFCMATQLV